MRDTDLNYIQTQDLDSILQKYKNKSEKFTDQFFPPVITSLVPANKDDPVVLKTPEKYVKDYLTYSFSRPEEVYGKGNYCIFSPQSQIGTQDIIQGAMASCYLIVTLANMARKPQRIKDLFLTKEVNEAGVYGMKVYVQGEPKVVLVDDYFPSKDNKLTFSLSHKKDNEMWIQICEKVWGKVNQSCYLRTFLGTPQEALYYLNPAPAYYIHHKAYSQYPDPLWDLMKSSLDKEYILCTNTEEIDEDAKNGLFKFHAYGVLDLQEIEGVKLIKLRNPWGDKIWKGKYGKVTEKEWTESMKKKANVSDLRSGSFFMEFSDYVQYFPWSFYSKVDDSWTYKYLKYEVSVDIGDHSEICRTVIENSMVQEMGKEKGNAREEDDILNLNHNPQMISQVGINNQSNSKGSKHHLGNSHNSNLAYYTNQVAENAYNINNINNVNDKESQKKNSKDKDQGKKFNPPNKVTLKLIDAKQSENPNQNPIPQQARGKPSKTSTLEREGGEHMVNLQGLENFKIKPEMLTNGDHKIFDIIDRNTAAAFVLVEKPTKACITFHQPQKRFIQDAQDTFEVPCGVIFLFKYQQLDGDNEDPYLKLESKYDQKKRTKNKANSPNNGRSTGKYQLISSNFHNFEKLYVEVDFEQMGEYHILCISQFENFDLKFNLVISAYSQIPLELYYLNRKDYVENWLLKLLKDLAIKNKCYSYFDSNEPESFFISYTNQKSNNTGFGILYYENNSADTSLKVRVALNDSASFRVLNAQRVPQLSPNNASSGKTVSSTRSFIFTVKSNSYKCLLLQFTQAMPFVSVQARHEVFFDYSKERVVKNFLRNKRTKRISLFDNLILYLIRYDRGFVFYCSNPSSSICSYFLTVTIKNLKTNLRIVEDGFKSSEVGVQGSAQKDHRENQRANIKIVGDDDGDGDEIMEIKESVEYANERKKQEEKVKGLNREERNPHYKRERALGVGQTFYLHVKTLYGCIGENETLEYEYDCKKI